jgi:chaperonin GroES
MMKRVKKSRKNSHDLCSFRLQKKRQFIMIRIVISTHTNRVLIILKQGIRRVLYVLKPLGDRLIIELVEKEEKTSSGIVLPDSAKEKPQEGRVVAVGSGKLTDKGERIAIEVAEGNSVVFSKYAGTEVKYDGKEYLILREDDVLAVIG